MDGGSHSDFDGLNKLEFKGADESHEQDLHLEDGKSVAKAASWANEEGEHTAPCTGEELSVGLASLFDPSLRSEDITITPDRGISVNCDGWDVDDLTSLDGNFMDETTVSANDGSTKGNDIILFGDLFISGRGREETETFTSDSVEIGEALSGPEFVECGLAVAGENFFAELLLDFWVHRECVEGEVENDRSGLVSGNNKGDNVVQELVIGNALLLLLSKVGTEKDGEQVASMLNVRDTAFDELVSERLDRVLDVALSLDGGNWELTDPGELAESQESDESVPDHSKVSLFAPPFHNRTGLGSLTLLEIVGECNATNNVESRGSSPVEHVDLVDTTLRLNSVVETSDDLVDGEPDIGSHGANAIECESGRDESTHGLVGFLSFYPDDTPSSKTLDDRPEDGRVRIVVSVLGENTVNSFRIGKAKNVMVTPCTLDLEIGSESRDPLLPLGTAIVLELEPFMAPYFRCAIRRRNVLETRKVVPPLVEDVEGCRSG